MMVLKIIFYVVLIALLAVGAMWISKTPGAMVAHWQDYEITLSTANFLLLTLLVITLIAIVIPLVLGVFAAPFRWWRKRQDAKFKKGLILVTETLAAIATGDATQADLLVKKCRKLLHGQPIVLLLQAQLAGIKKDQILLEQSFQSMLEHSETKALASKSLAELHLRKGEVMPALSHAQRAMDLEPKNSQSMKTTLMLYLKSAQYDSALELLLQGKKRRSLTRAEYASLRAMVLAMQAAVAEEKGSKEEAYRLIREAYKIAPQQPNIYAAYIDAHNVDVHISQAVNALKRAWDRNFTTYLPALAEDLLLEDRARKKLYKKLLASGGRGKPYVLLMLAKMALKEQDAFEALAWLKKWVQAYPMAAALPADMVGRPTMEGVTHYVTQAWQGLPILGFECTACGARSDAWHALCRECQTINAISAV